MDYENHCHFKQDHFNIWNTMRAIIVFIFKINKSFTQIILNTIVPWIKIQSETDNYAHGIIFMLG